MPAIIVFPTNFASSTLDITGQLVTDFLPLILIVSGVILAVVVVVILISVLMHHGK